MKVITLIQPWATLIAIREKKIETRGWKTDYRGPLLIHAGKTKECLYLCDKEPFKSVLARYGYDKNNLPMGAIVAKTNLKECIKVKTEWFSSSLTVAQAELEDGKIIEGNELKFGNYAKGRYAWRMENVEMLKEPIPAKGQQRLWNFNYKE